MRVLILLGAALVILAGCSLSSPSFQEQEAFRAALKHPLSAKGSVRRDKSGKLADVSAVRQHLGRLHQPVPGGTLTSGFGWRSSRFHEGVDIAAPAGTPIRAAHDGEVIFVSKGFYGYGRTVIIQGGGLVTLYAHNSANHVEVGDTVERGEWIADVGQTGDASGPHCHFEVRVLDEVGRYVAVNPLRFLDRRV